MRTLPRIGIVIMAVCCLTNALLPQSTRNEDNINYVLDRYLDAMGGRANLEKVLSTRLSGTLKYPDGAQYQITVLKKRPNLSRIVLDTKTVRFIQAYNGKYAWFSQESGNKAIYERMSGKMAEDFIRDAPLENYLVDPYSTGVVVALGPDVQLPGTPCFQIVSTFPDGAKVIHYVDKKEYIERRIIHLDAAGVQLNEMIPGKFETIDGVLFAMQMVQMKDGKVVSTLELDQIETNLGVLDSTFDPPLYIPEN